MPDINDKDELQFWPGDLNISRGEKNITDEDFNATKFTPDPSQSKNIVSQADIFKSAVDKETFPDDFLIINDVYLTNVPTASISMSSPTDVFVAETLRTSAPVVASKGRQDFIVNLSLPFKPGEAQQEKLRRIIAEITKNPFTFIYNNKIRKALNIDEFESLIFVVEAGALRSTTETVGLIILDLTMHLFNYKPFSKHFYYNAYLGKENLPEGKQGTSDLPLDLGNMVGYEPEEHSSSLHTEKVKQDIRNTITVQTSATENVPVNFPSESVAWMYYADYLSTEDMIPKISATPSDYLGFIVHEYQYFTPPDKAKEGNPISKWTEKGEWREPTSPYKPNGLDSTYYETTTQERDIDLLLRSRNTGLHLDSDSLATYKVKTNRREYNVQIDDLTALWMARMLLGETGERGKASQRHMIAVLWAMMNRWSYLLRGRYSSYLDAMRAFSQPINRKWVPGGSLYEKHKKKNIRNGKFITAKKISRRLRISSIEWNKIPNRVTSLVNQFRRGKVSYPTEFSNLKYSKVSNWGSKKEIPEEIKKKAGNKTLLVIGGNVFFEDKSIGGGRLQIIPPENTREENAVYPVIKPEAKKIEEEKERKKKQAKKPPVNPKKEVIEQDYLARQNWIEEQSRQGWWYYDQDPKVRNIFYKTNSVNVSGNHSIQRGNSTLNNIVCSALAISFGHRIVPMKLLSQSYNTYQFLGAGNKTGQIVFTYSGREGRISADYIKSLIYGARESAKKFGAIIKEAGTVSLSSFSGDGEQNAILALLNIDAVIVTNIEESSSPDGVDKHQMVIEFISQDFMEESYEKRFTTSLDSKKRIIKSLMDMILSNKASGISNKDHFNIKPKASFVKNSRGEYHEVVGNTPSWLASAVAKTAKLCQEINDQIPPVTWKSNKITSSTWRDNYTKWGAGEVFHGKVKNISSNERNRVHLKKEPSKNTNPPSIYNQDYGAVPVSIYTSEGLKTQATDEMYAGVFSFDGGPETNKKHEQLFREWLDKMGLIVQEVKKNVGDEENFTHYFGSIGQEMLDNATSSMGECYNDLSLPVVPDSPVVLPPEFYIYNDSSEDPLVANATNKENLEKYLLNHINLELESIKHFMRDTLCGGSYISKNLPRILQNRRETQDLDWAQEFSFIDNFSQLISEGATAWEPIHYKSDPVIDNDPFVALWKAKISNGLGGGSKEKQQLSFMSNLTNLSGYLKSGRKWTQGYQEPDQSIVESLYGDAWNNISFGPNPEYSTTDDTMNGKLTLPSIAEQRELAIKSAAEKAKRIGEDIKVSSDITVTKEGAVTVSSSLEAAEEEERENKRVAPTPAARVGAPIPFGAPIPLDTSVRNAFEKSVMASQNLDALSHDVKNKITEGNAAREISKITAGVALGGRENDLSMRRAFPTFKIYLIEDDSKETIEDGGQVLRAFDDFYSYSSIQEIRVTRSRKIASDLAVIRMTNVGGKLLSKRFGEHDRLDPKYGVGTEKQGIFADTELENPFKRMILQDGVKVQIRLGYSSNPDHLESVFLGQIVEIQPGEGGKLIEITCQGYGAELEAIELGPLEDGPVFYSSQQVLSGAIIQDSVSNFGRQSKFNRFNPAEIRNAWNGGTGHGSLGAINPVNIIESWSDNKMDQLLNKYTFLNYPQDDNIFAPPPSLYTTAWKRFWNNACLYRPLKQTPWQIFQEHELRHPGYISLAVPYGHSPRMTMFFGAKSQHYWSRPPSSFEIYLSENAKNEMIRFRNARPGTEASEEAEKDLKKFSESSPSLALAMLRDIGAAGAPNAVAQYIAKEFGRYIPFRNYHYLDSAHHIIKNNIRTSVDGTFNEVEILYFEDEDKLQEADIEDLVENLDELQSGQAGLLSVKLDENIDPSSIRSFRQEFPSCVTTEMARRYAQGIFARHLRDAYKGDLVVLGKETIKPYDICYVNDASINMTGPIEVEAVTQIFSSQNGFVSVITPDLCVDVNDMFSAAVFDIAADANAVLWAGKTKWLTGSLKGLSFLGLAAGVKFASWTQDGDPVVTTPLTLGGKPLISTSLGPKDTSLMLRLRGEWRQYWDDLGDAWRRFDFSEAFLDTSLDIQQGVYTTLGTDFDGGVV